MNNLLTIIQFLKWTICKKWKTDFVLRHILSLLSLLENNSADFFFLVWFLKSQEQLAASLYTRSDSGVIHMFALQILPMMWPFTGSVLIGFH